MPLALAMQGLGEELAALDDETRPYSPGDCAASALEAFQLFDQLCLEAPTTAAGAAAFGLRAMEGGRAQRLAQALGLDPDWRCEAWTGDGDHCHDVAALAGIDAAGVERLRALAAPVAGEALAAILEDAYARPADATVRIGAATWRKWTEANDPLGCLAAVEGEGVTALVSLPTCG